MTIKVSPTSGRAWGSFGPLRAMVLPVSAGEEGARFLEARLAWGEQ